MANNEEFLGDGLYVSFDGWHFCLRAPRSRISGTVPTSMLEVEDHVVYLEMGHGHTLEKFEDYVKRMRQWMEDEHTKLEKQQARVRDSREGFAED